MIYSYKITGNESEAFRLLIGGMACTGVLRPELDRHISEVAVGDYSPRDYLIFAGSSNRDFYKPYLAGKDDIIAFDTAQMMVKYDVYYNRKPGDNKRMLIAPKLGFPESTLYPLIATLMHAANDIDISDDNFRVWLINNRPKVNKVGKMDIPEENNELFKFLQLRERAGDVKITQEIGQELFKALFDRANAIAHEEVSSDALATDTSEFMLALVNNIINSAPKPATRFDRVELKDFIRMNAMYMKENGQQLLSGEDYYIAGTDEADALRVLGEPCPTVTCCKVWYFSMYGRIICRVYSAGHELVLSVARGTLLSMREQVLDDVIDMLLNSGRLNGKK